MDGWHPDSYAGYNCNTDDSIGVYRILHTDNHVDTSADTQSMNKK